MTLCAEGREICECLMSALVLQLTLQNRYIHNS